jgi:hypothetical protein
VQGIGVAATGIGNGLTIIGVDVPLRDISTSAIVATALLSRRIGGNTARAG